MALLGAVAWLLGTESGLRWAVAEAQSASAGRLRIEGASGTLASGVAAERIAYRAEGFVLEARKLSARVQVAAALSARLVIEPLRLDSLDIGLAQTDDQPPKVPALPFALRIAQVEVARFAVTRGDARYALEEVRISQFTLNEMKTLSGEGSFRVAEGRFPATGKLTLQGSLERLQSSLQLNTLGASAEAKAVLTLFQARRIESIEARASAIDLARFDASLPRTAITAQLKAAGAGSGLAGTLSFANRGAGPLDSERLPVASFDARFAAQDLKSAALNGVRIVLAGGGVLEGGGRIGTEQVEATLNAKALNLRALRSTLRQTELAGSLNIVVSRDAQYLRGELSQEGISLSAEAVRKGDVIEIGALHAAAGGGEVSGTGRVRIADPLSFEARLVLRRFDPAAFGDYPEGSISGALGLQGRLGEALQIDANWTVGDSTLLGRALETRGSARFARRALSNADAQARLGASRLTARGSFGKPGDKLALTLEVPRLQELSPQLGGRMQASGTLGGTWETPQADISARAEAVELAREIALSSVTAQIAGTLARHEVHLTAQASDTAIDARLRGGLNGRQAWSGEVLSLSSSGEIPLTLLAPAALKVSRQRIELGRTEATLGEGRLVVREVAWARERLASSGEFSGLPAQWLFLAAGIAERLRSTLLLDGQWSIAAAPELDGMLRIRRASGDVVLLDERPIELGLQAASLDARFTNAGVAAKMDLVSRFVTAALGGQLGRAPGAGALGIGRDSPLLLQGRVELANVRLIAQPFLPDARVDGRVTADIEASGTLGAPVFGGTLRGDALSFDLPPYGVYLKNGTLRARVERDIMNIEEFSIQGGEGRFSASGSLPLRFADGNAKLVWRARSFTVLDRPDMRLIASGEGEAGFDGKKLSLSGELRADRGNLEFERERLPRLGDDVVITGQNRPAVKQKEKGPLPLALNVDLDLGSDLAINMQGLEGKLAGRVNVSTNKDGDLRAYGRLHTVNATYFAYGQRLQVDPGVLIFDGPIDNPALQITAWRRNQAVEAGVQLTGTVRAPRVQLVSQPPVSENERLSWLVLGRAPGDATKADLGLLQAAAGALLARGDSLPLDRRLARNFGLDEVSFRGSGEVQDRVLAFGKRLSDRLYVSYEQGLGTTASNLVKLDYSLSRRWSLRAETGTSSGWGLFYRFSWD